MAVAAVVWQVAYAISLVGIVVEDMFTLVDGFLFYEIAESFQQVA